MACKLQKLSAKIIRSQSQWWANSGHKMASSLSKLKNSSSCTSLFSVSFLSSFSDHYFHLAVNKLQLRSSVHLDSGTLIGYYTFWRVSWESATWSLNMIRFIILSDKLHSYLRPKSNKRHFLSIWLQLNHCTSCSSNILRGLLAGKLLVYCLNSFRRLSISPINN